MLNNRSDAYDAVNQLAIWSEWAPFAAATPLAPRTPGVYQMRVPDGTIVYIGMAGERRGQGLRGRLSIYRRGKGAVSGFGEAALDRALADATFIEEHLLAVRNGQPARASVWARDAIALMRVEVRWAECQTPIDAEELEGLAVALLKTHSIWNRVAAVEERARHLDAGPTASVVNSTHALLGVKDLALELGHTDRGRAVRATLRKGFPEHPANYSWDPLSSAQVAHVRSILNPRR